MGERIGLIAGAGTIPLLALAEAKAQGWSCAVAGLRGNAPPEIQSQADIFVWIDPAEADKLIAFFKEQGVRRVLLAGKFDPRLVLQKDGPGETFRRFLAGVKDKTPTGLIGAFIEFLAGQDLSVIDPAFLLARFFCPAGRLASTQPSPAVLEDIDYGWDKARRLADEDIGQTLVVKDRSVIAVEGLEGTDETIKRAGRLAGAGVVVIKIARTRQDMRIDVPAVGVETMRNLVRIEAAALCLEAGRMPFFDRTEAVALADANRIAVLARNA
jgi:UDP-2,3-diacylglucosamine hydrolase